jgi:hypothetical protein
VGCGENARVGLDAASDVAGSDVPDSNPILPSTGCAAPIVLVESALPPLGVFAVRRGILVVLPHHAILLDRQGNTLARKQFERPATLAAYDSGWLAVADTKSITAFTEELETRSVTQLRRACGAGVFVADQRFVCGTGTGSWDTYDLFQAALVATTPAGMTEGPQLMRSAPELNTFVTFNAGIIFYSMFVRLVTPLGTVVDEGGWSIPNEFSSFQATRLIAFAGNRSDKIVTEWGAVLQLFGKDCDPRKLGDDKGCLVRVGQTPGITTGDRYLALARDETGRLLAIVRKAPSPPFYGLPGPPDPNYGSSHRVQVLDPLLRFVVADRPFDLSAKAIVSTTADTTCNMMVVTIEKDPSAGPGFVVVLTEHGAPKALPTNAGASSEQPRPAPTGHDGGEALPNSGPEKDAGPEDLGDALSEDTPAAAPAGAFQISLGASEIPADGHSWIPVVVTATRPDGGPAVDDLLLNLDRPAAGLLKPNRLKIGPNGEGAGYFIPCAQDVTSCIGPVRIRATLPGDPAIVAESPVVQLVVPTGIGSPAACLRRPNAMFVDGNTFFQYGVKAITDAEFVADSQLTDASSIVITVKPQDAIGGFWNHRFSSKRLGQPLVEQVYRDGDEFFQGTADHAGINVSGNGGACSRVKGAFQIHKLTWSGPILKEALITYEETCNGNSELSGCIHYTSP